MILEKDQIIQKEIISYLAIDQIRTIDKSRIVKELRKFKYRGNQKNERGFTKNLCFIVYLASVFSGNAMLKPILMAKIPMITAKECMVPNPQASR